MEKPNVFGAESSNNFQRFNQWIQNSTIIKIGTIAILVLLLLIPASMIGSIIRERAALQENAKIEISGKWGNSQTVAGPILTIPYKTYDRDTSGKIVKFYTNYAHFLPESLSIMGFVTPQIRNRGIYKAILYNAKLRIQGDFSIPDFFELNIADEDVMYDQAYLSIGVSDMRGIKENITVAWDTKTFIAEPGVGNSDVLSSGINVSLANVAGDLATKKHSFLTNINLNGSEQLQFMPLGKETLVKLTSSWAAPSFNGEFLPYERTISKDGFNAQWKILQLNRNYPQKWIGNAYNVTKSVFGVNLIMPVDEYQKITRTSKYALLFISLTFCAFFFVEIMNRRRLHAIQYLLIGFALCLFYSLLLSLSECIGFGYAYLIAGAAITGLIAGYTNAVFKSMRITCCIGGVVAVLYSFLYVILQQEDFALLIGSVGLLMILAIIMFLTRKLDWYSLKEIKENPNK